MPSAAPYDRELRGQTSAVMIHAQGPHEYPKWTTKSQTILSTQSVSTSFWRHDLQGRKEMRKKRKKLRLRHGCPSSCRLTVPLVLVPGEDDRDDEMAQGHPDGTDGQDRLASHAVDPEYRWNGPGAAVFSRGMKSAEVYSPAGAVTGFPATYAMNMTMPTTPVARRDLFLDQPVLHVAKCLISVGTHVVLSFMPSC